MFRRSPGARLGEGRVVGDIAVVLPIPKFASICGAFDANFGIEGALAIFNSSAALDLKFR
jgi:hypothetical protein